MDQQIAPQTEFSSRLAALQSALAREGIALALVRQAADLIYYAGTPVDGFLAVPTEGEPRLLVRRPQRRPLAGPWPFTFYKDLRELPALLDRSGLSPRGPVGLETD